MVSYHSTVCIHHQFLLLQDKGHHHRHQVLTIMACALQTNYKQL